MFGRYIGREVYIDNAIFLSERTTGHRNRAIAHLMLNFGMVSEQIPDSLELYFQQCSILVNAHDLAVMGATLANAGVNPVTKERAIDRQYVKDVLSVMLTCGMYDYAGEWAYRVGLPAKSGVGGGICAVVPGRCGIGIFSPLLDPRGNSVRGIKVCEELSAALRPARVRARLRRRADRRAVSTAARHAEAEPPRHATPITQQNHARRLWHQVPTDHVEGQQCPPPSRRRSCAGSRSGHHDADR